MTIKIVCLISGGIDSTVLFFMLAKNNHDIMPLFINYGQKAAKQEKKAAIKSCDILKLQLNTINISGLSSISTGLTDENLFVSNPFFPNRNLILLSMAGAFSVNHSYDVLAIGVIGGTNYSDQTKEFVNDAETVLSYNRKTVVLAPLVNLNKLEVVRLSKINNIPLNFTYSCYLGNEKPCYECSGCIDRKKVFELEDITQH